MGGAVVVFLSFQLHCTYTYMKQFPRQRPGASHHLHDASARNVNTLARPINPSCQLAIITETYTNAASSSQMQEKRHQNPRAVPDGGPTIGHVHSFSPPCSIFRPWGSPHSDSDLPVRRDVCWAPTSSRLDRWLLLLLLLIIRMWVKMEDLGDHRC